MIPTHQKTNKQHTCLILFIDVKAVYDSVPRPELFSRLVSLRVLSPQEVYILRTIYDNSVMRIGKKGFRPERGVLQGSTISLFLFNIFLEDLIQTLIDNSIPWNTILAFADDLAVMAFSKEIIDKASRLIDSWLTHLIHSDHVLSQSELATLRNLDIRTKSRLVDILINKETPPRYHYNPSNNNQTARCLLT